MRILLFKIQPGSIYLALPPSINAVCSQVSTCVFDYKRLLQGRTSICAFSYQWIAPIKRIIQSFNEVLLDIKKTVVDSIPVLFNTLRCFSPLFFIPLFGQFFLLFSQPCFSFLRFLLRLCRNFNYCLRPPVEVECFFKVLVSRNKSPITEGQKRYQEDQFFEVPVNHFKLLPFPLASSLGFKLTPALAMSRGDLK